MGARRRGECWDKPATPRDPLHDSGVILGII